MLRAIITLAFIGCTAASARAGGFSLALSGGSGYRTSPEAGRVATNLLVAPGFDLLGDLLRLEVGFAADLPDIADSDFDVQLRPMAVLNLPIVPLYVRAVTGVTQLVRGPLAFAFGGVLGIDADVGTGAAVFAEAGFIPRARRGQFESVFEGRLGLRFH